MSKHNNKATAGLVFGIISMLSWVLLIDYSISLYKVNLIFELYILSTIVMFVVFPISVLGIVFGSLGICSQKRTAGITGLILSVIGFMGCLINLLMAVRDTLNLIFNTLFEYIPKF